MTLITSLSVPTPCPGDKVPQGAPFSQNPNGSCPLELSSLLVLSQLLRYPHQCRRGPRLNDVREGERASGQRTCFLDKGCGGAWHVGMAGVHEERWEIGMERGNGIAAKGLHAKNFRLHSGQGILNVGSWQKSTVRPAQCFKKS